MPAEIANTTPQLDILENLEVDTFYILTDYYVWKTDGALNVEAHTGNVPELRDFKHQHPDLAQGFVGDLGKVSVIRDLEQLARANSLTVRDCLEA